METVALNAGRGDGFVLALGFFDSIHIGHRALIASARSEAALLGASCAVFTFRNGVYTKDGAGLGLVYPYRERLELLAGLGVDAVVAEDFDASVCATPPRDFLDGLFGAVSVRAVVCGEDYTYGAKKTGDAATLKAYCRLRGVPLQIEKDFCLYGHKVSTSRIKAALSEGDVETANALLGSPFALSGTVINGRREGRKHGYPTCNQRLPDDKFLPKRGVYGSYAVIDGIRFCAVTNLGAQPTFGLDATFCAETHLIGFEGDLYGKTLRVELHRYLRGVQRFESPDALYAQLEKDKQWT